MKVLLLIVISMISCSKMKAKLKSKLKSKLDLEEFLMKQADQIANNQQVNQQNQENNLQSSFVEQFEKIRNLKNNKQENEIQPEIVKNYVEKNIKQNDESQKPSIISLITKSLKKKQQENKIKTFDDFRMMQIDQDTQEQQQNLLNLSQASIIQNSVQKPNVQEITKSSNQTADQNETHQIEINKMQDSYVNKIFDMQRQINGFQDQIKQLVNTKQQQDQILIDTDDFQIIEKVKNPDAVKNIQIKLIEKLAKEIQTNCNSKENYPNCFSLVQSLKFNPTQKIQDQDNQQEQNNDNKTDDKVNEQFDEIKNFILENNKYLENILPKKIKNQKKK